MHFRAHGRRPVRLVVTVQRSSAAAGSERPGTVVDVSLAGAGLETEDLLVPGERLAIAFSTPTMWDALVIRAVVAWSAPPPTEARMAMGRGRPALRSGVAFEYDAPETPLAVLEMLATLGYE